MRNYETEIFFDKDGHRHVSYKVERSDGLIKRVYSHNGKVNYVLMDVDAFGYAKIIECKFDDKRFGVM